MQNNRAHCSAGQGAEIVSSSNASQNFKGRYYADWSSLDIDASA
jgi:hypothetical protein